MTEPGEIKNTTATSLPKTGVKATAQVDVGGRPTIDLPNQDTTDKDNG